METNQSTFAKIGNFLRGNSNANKRIMTWKQSGEHEDWAKKAVDILVKKLKKQPDALKKLEFALATRKPQTDCVTIPRTLDGRLQVSHSKFLPHVMYCRIWRWPDLMSQHELRQSKSCLYPYMAKVRTDIVCINPYHYERVEHKILPPILVPRQSEFAPGYSKLPSQQPTQQQVAQTVMMDGNGVRTSNTLEIGSQCPSGEASPMSDNCNFSSNGQFPGSLSPSSPPPPYQENSSLIQNQNNVVQVHYEEAEYWATAAYYELNTRVGEQFRCSYNANSLVVDGFTNPSSTNSNRFCLGLLSNINRNSTIESTRKHIGKGVTISLVNHELYLECNSDYPVFVGCPMTTHLHNSTHGTVYKVMPKCYLKIFDNNEFARCLGEVVNSGFEATYALTKMCTLRISFVKGWGAQYHRQDITSTPCWIEVHLNGPLKWLDDVLIKMGSPLYNITSVS